MTRSTNEIASDVQAIIDNSSKAFVPAPVVKICELTAEFMGAAGAELAGLREELASLRASAGSAGVVADPVAQA